MVRIFHKYSLKIPNLIIIQRSVNYKYIQDYFNFSTHRGLHTFQRSYKLNIHDYFNSSIREIEEFVQNFQITSTPILIRGMEEFVQRAHFQISIN